MKFYLYILLLFNTLSFAANTNDMPQIDLPNLPHDIIGLLINSLDMNSIRNIYQTNKFYRNFINDMIEKNRLSPYLSWAILPIQKNNLNNGETVQAISSDNDFLITRSFSKWAKFDIKANKYSWEKDIKDTFDIVLDHTNNLIFTSNEMFKPTPESSLNIYDTHTGQLINSMKFKYKIHIIYASKKDNTFAISYDTGTLDIYKINHSNIELINSIVLNSDQNHIPQGFQQFATVNARDVVESILDLNDEYIIIKTRASVEKLNIRSSGQDRDTHLNLNLAGSSTIKISPDHSKLIIVKEDNTFDKYIAEIWDVATNNLIQTISYNTSDLKVEDSHIPIDEHIPVVRFLIGLGSGTDINLNFDNSLTIINNKNTILIWDNKINKLIYKKRLNDIEKLIIGNKSNFIIALTSTPTSGCYYLNFIDLSKDNLIKEKFISRKIKVDCDNSILASNRMIAFKNINLSQDDSVLLTGPQIYTYSFPKPDYSKKRSHDFIPEEEESYEPKNKKRKS